MEWLRRQLEHLPMPSNPGGLVYGTILIATLMGAEAVKTETYVQTLVGLALAEIAYWLAFSYAEFTGERTAEAEPFTLKRFWVHARHELSVMLGGVLPMLVLIGCWIAGVSVYDGLTIAIYTAALMIVAAEFVIGIRSGHTGRQLLANVLIGVLFGLLVISIKVVLH